MGECPESSPERPALSLVLLPPVCASRRRSCCSILAYTLGRSSPGSRRRLVPVERHWEQPRQLRCTGWPSSRRRYGHARRRGSGAVRRPVRTGGSGRWEKRHGRPQARKVAVKEGRHGIGQRPAAETLTLVGPLSGQMSGQGVGHRPSPLTSSHGRAPAPSTLPARIASTPALFALRSAFSSGESGLRHRHPSLSPRATNNSTPWRRASSMTAVASSLLRTRYPSGIAAPSTLSTSTEPPFSSGFHGGSVAVDGVDELNSRVGAPLPPAGTSTHWPSPALTIRRGLVPRIGGISIASIAHLEVDGRLSDRPSARSTRPTDGLPVYRFRRERRRSPCLLPNQRDRTAPASIAAAPTSFGPSGVVHRPAAQQMHSIDKGELAA